MNTEPVPNGKERATERAVVLLTPYEKRALKIVSAHRDVPQSTLLREHTIAEVLAAYHGD